MSAMVDCYVVIFFLSYKTNFNVYQKPKWYWLHNDNHNESSMDAALDIDEDKTKRTHAYTLNMRKKQYINNII